MKIWSAFVKQISWSNRNKSLSFSNENMAGLSKASFVEPRLVSKMSANVFPQINREHNLGRQSWRKSCKKNWKLILKNCVGEWNFAQRNKGGLTCLLHFIALVKAWGYLELAVTYCPLSSVYKYPQFPVHLSESIK